MLVSVGCAGDLMLGAIYAGQRFEIEERSGGELLLRPVKQANDLVERCVATPLPVFAIAEVERVVMPSREHLNARD